MTESTREAWQLSIFGIPLGLGRESIMSPHFSFHCLHEMTRISVRNCVCFCLKLYLLTHAFDIKRGRHLFFRSSFYQRLDSIQLLQLKSFKFCLYPSYHILPGGRGILEKKKSTAAVVITFYSTLASVGTH